MLILIELRHAACAMGYYRVQHSYRKAGKSVIAGSCQVRGSVMP